MKIFLNICIINAVFVKCKEFFMVLMQKRKWYPYIFKNEKKLKIALYIMNCKFKGKC